MVTFNKFNSTFRECDIPPYKPTFRQIFGSLDDTCNSLFPIWQFKAQHTNIAAWMEYHVIIISLYTFMIDSTSFNIDFIQYSSGREVVNHSVSCTGS